MLKRLGKAFRHQLGMSSRELRDTVSRAQTATDDHNWIAAAENWRICFEEFPNQVRPYWYLELARAQSEHGRLGEAERALLEMIGEFPDVPAGYAALARLAMRHRDWETAIERWQICLDRFPHDTGHDWYTSQTRALLHSERRASSLMKSLARADQAARSRRGPVGDRHRRDELLSRLIERFKGDLVRAEDHDHADFMIFEILARFGRLHEARMLLDEIAEHVRSSGAAVPIVQAISSMFEGNSRTERLRDLESKLAERIRRANGGPDAKDLTVARLVALLALRDDEEFEHCYAEYEPVALPSRLRLLEHVRGRLLAPTGRETGRGKVFGVGLSKTGTSSLALALDKLGYVSIHWVNPLTRTLIDDGDFPLFDAFTDTSVCFQFERIYGLFPEARFIYTTRPIDAWVRSIENHFEMRRGVHGIEHLRWVIGDPMQSELGQTFRDIQQNLYCRHASFADAYRHHDARVKSFFAGERRDQLLEFDVFCGDGWEQLSAFLDKPAPDEPFPWENRESPAAE